MTSVILTLEMFTYLSSFYNELLLYENNPFICLWGCTGWTTQTSNLFLYCQTFLTRTGLTISTLNILIKFLAFSVTSISIILNKNILPPYSPVGLLKVVNFYNGILWGFVENALNFLIFPYFMYFCARDFFFFQQ